MFFPSSLPVFLAFARRRGRGRRETRSSICDDGRPSRPRCRRRRARRSAKKAGARRLMIFPSAIRNPKMGRTQIQYRRKKPGKPGHGTNATASTKSTKRKGNSRIKQLPSNAYRYEIAADESVQRISLDWEGALSHVRYITLSANCSIIHHVYISPLMIMTKWIFPSQIMRILLCLIL